MSLCRHSFRLGDLANLEVSLYKVAGGFILPMHPKQK